MPILFECQPIPDLRVIPIANIITRACLAPCFLDGMSKYHTIPHRFRSQEKRCFEGGRVDTLVPSGVGSKLYELNLYAMNFGRPKERTVSVQAELAQRDKRKEQAAANAAAKKKETWAKKRASTGRL